MIERPLPRPTEDTAPYWEAARRGELRLQRCADCGHWRFPPALLCPRCLSDACAWERVSGRGRIFSWILVHRPAHPAFQPDAPYNVVVVELEEGPRLHSNLVGCPNEAIHIGLPVEVVFDRIHDEVALPRFRPAREED